MKVSIIICSYNREKLIGRAVESILLQSFTDFEIIVIDDASTDNTEQVVRSLMQKDLRIKYYKNKTNLGISKSRNYGVKLSNGEYIAMLDSDDYWIDNFKLQKQIEILDNDKNIGLIGSAIRCEDENEKFIKNDIFNREDTKIRKVILSKNQFAQSSVLFRKDIFQETGGYDENLEVCEDYDLWLKIGKVSKYANIQDVSTAYMIHSGGISKSKKLLITTTTNQIIDKYKNDFPGYTLAKIKSLTRVLVTYF